MFHFQNRLGGPVSKDLDVGQIDDTFAVGFHGGLEKRVFAQATVNLDVGKR